MDVRQLEAQDLPAVKHFTDEWIGKDYYSLQELEDIFSKSFDGVLNASFCAWVDGQLAGVRLTLAPGHWIGPETRGVQPQKWRVPANRVAYFKSLFIGGTYQRQGLGQALSSSSLRVLKQMGAQAVLCHSWLESPGNSSQIYLKRMGFGPVNTYPRFWHEIDYECVRCRPGRCVCTAVEMIKYLDEEGESA